MKQKSMLYFGLICIVLLLESCSGSQQQELIGTNPPPDLGSSDDFYMIVASDPQWPWTPSKDCAGYSNCPADPYPGDKEASATKLNENHVKAMNALIDQLTPQVKGLIINGDLVAWNNYEFDENTTDLAHFKKIYNEVNNKVPMYLGLGNHDYSNNESVEKVLF